MRGHLCHLEKVEVLKNRKNIYLEPELKGGGEKNMEKSIMSLYLR